MLVTLPIGLWIFSFACDLSFTFGAGDPVWKTVALYSMGGGLIGALAAAVPGLIDLLSLPVGIRRTAILHMWVNLTVVGLFALNLLLRVSGGHAGADAIAPVWLSLAALALLVVSGWLGGKLVYERGVAVDTDGLDLSVGRPGVINLSRFREQRRNGKKQGSTSQRPRSPEPPISSWRP